MDIIVRKLYPEEMAEAEKECAICLELVRVSEMTTLSCDHRFCLVNQCLANHCVAQIDEHRVS
jgi:hypothetical protein